MKKLLALVLALVMTMSLVTISNAAFKDADKIDHTEAVEVMNALGVINGMPDGSFNPSGNVTRAEMAKMITIIMLGDIDAAAFKGTTTDLTDINGHWAEGYIKYCYSQGVIAGRGDGTFAPNANVTAVEAAKMLLVAIGYNATVQGYVGSDWTINVIRDAQLSKFFDKLTLVSTKVLTRDEAAQMIYNAVKAKTIEKSSSVDRTTGNITDIYNVTGNPLLTKTFNAKEYVGVMDSISYSSSNSKYSYDGTADFKNKADNADIHSGAAFVSKTDYSALEAEEVAIIEKTETNGDKTVLGIYATGKSVVVTSAVSALEADGAKLKVNGTKYECEGSVSTALVAPHSYDTVKLVDSDANGKLDKAVRTSVTPVKVTYVSAKEIIAGGTSYKVADNKIESGLAKNDYVTVIANADESYTIAKLEKTTGKVEGYKTGKVLVNGAWYNFMGSEFTSSDAGKNVEFYAVNGVVVTGTAKVVNSDKLDNVIMALQNDASNSTVPYIKVLFADGTKKAVKLDTVSTGVTVTSVTPGNLYSYTESDNGYKLKAAATIGDYTYGTGAATGSSKVELIDSKPIADDAVIFVYTGDNNGKVISGKALKNTEIGSSNNNIKASTTKGYYVGETGGMDRVVLAAVESATTTFATSETAKYYGLIVENAYQVDSDYITYKIWTGEDVVTVREKDTSVLASRTQMALIGYASLTDGVIKDVAAAGATKAAVKGLIGNEVSFDGTTMKKLTGDTVYMYYDSSKTEADEIGLKAGELQLATKIEGIAVQNVKYILDGSDVDFILIDVKNSLKDGDTKTITLTNSVTADAASAKVKFTNADGDVITSGDMKAGDIVNVVISGGTSADTVKITFTAANTKCAGAYTSGTTINVAANASAVTYTFVVTGAANDTIVVADV